MQCFLGPAVQPRCQLRAVPSMQRWNTPRHPAAMCPLVCGGPARARSMAWARQHQHADPYMHQGTVFCLPLPIGTTLPPLPCLLSVRTARPPTRRPPARLPAWHLAGWLAGCRKERYLAYRGSLMYAGVARVCAEHRPDLTTVVEVTAYRSPAAGGRPITLNGANLTETLQACGWHACAGARPFLH